MVPLVGYVDRFSACPGETVAVKVSSELGDPYRADLVRIIHGDANPVGPGLKFEEIFRDDSGRAVFSVGSITFCGRLSHNNYQNNISRILENVLRRFVTK